MTEERSATLPSTTTTTEATTSTTEAETTVLEESVYGEDGSERILLTFNVAAIADLNGDSKMEIVLNWGYYEGSGVEVFEYVSDDVGPISQIGQGCGV